MADWFGLLVRLWALLAAAAGVRRVLLLGAEVACLRKICIFL